MGDTESVVSISNTYIILNNGLLINVMYIKYYLNRIYK